MKKEIFKIVPYSLSSPNNHRLIYLSASMAEHLNLKENSRYTLLCGVNRIPVQIKTVSAINRLNNVLGLTNDILKEILIPEGIRIEVIFTEEIIKIGPIIAVLTENKLMQDYLKGTDIVEEYSLYADMAEEVHGLIYIFSLSGLNLEYKYINGFTPIKEKNKWIWINQNLPMPDAICNRMAVAVSSPAYKKIKSIEEIVPDIKIINRVTKISKWTIAKLLQENPHASKYIPETRILGEAEDIVNMLEKYSAIYLKPVRRSLGLGIIKIEKNTSGNYTAYYNIDSIKHKIDGDVNSILRRLGDVMGNR